MQCVSAVTLQECVRCVSACRRREDAVREDAVAVPEEDRVASSRARSTSVPPKLRRALLQAVEVVVAGEAAALADSGQDPQSPRVTIS